MKTIDDLRNEQGEIQHLDIPKIIPYQDNFLFLGKICFLDKNIIKANTDIKNTDFWVNSHFVDFPIMPGVLIIEALAQAATVLVRYNLPDHEIKDILAHSINQTTFLHPIFPGDTITVTVKLLQMDGKKASLKGEVYVGDTICSQSEFTLAIVDKIKFRGKYA